MVRLNLDTAPTATTLIPVSTAKEFLRVDFSADDTLIANLITAGVEIAQNYTNTKFLTHTYTLSMESWDDVYVSNSDIVYSNNYFTYGGFYSKYTGLAQIVLPYPPLKAITHLKYYDTDNVQQTWADTNYWAGTWINQKGFIEIKQGVSTPELYNRADAIEIKFECGYGSSSSDVPDAIKQAIL